MSSNEKLKVPIGGYIALIFAILYFSGLIPVIASNLDAFLEGLRRGHLLSILALPDAPADLVALINTYIETKASNSRELIKTYLATHDYAPLQTWLVYVSGTWLNGFDFGALQGHLGTIIDGKATFRGAKGSGAKDGFMFALTLVPSVMLALGSIELIEHYGGLKAAQKLLTPLLRPLMGLPGISGLSLISSLQSTDAGAAMSKALKEEGHITENERTVFGMFQFSGGAMITNFLSSGAAIIVLVAPTIAPIIIISFGVILFFKFLGANMMRIYVRKFGEEG